MPLKLGIRAGLVATILSVTLFAGCGEDSEQKIVRDAHPSVPPLAPGSQDGMDSRKVDPGAADIPSGRTP